MVVAEAVTVVVDVEAVVVENAPAIKSLKKYRHMSANRGCPGNTCEVLSS